MDNFVVITGCSGSGKSTLVGELQRRRRRGRDLGGRLGRRRRGRGRPGGVTARVARYQRRNTCAASDSGMRCLRFITVANR